MTDFLSDLNFTPLRTYEHVFKELKKKVQFRMCLDRLLEASFCKRELRAREILQLIPCHTAKYWPISSENSFVARIQNFFCLVIISFFFFFFENRQLYEVSYFVKPGNMESVNKLMFSF